MLQAQKNKISDILVNKESGNEFKKPAHPDPRSGFTCWLFFERRCN